MAATATPERPTTAKIPAATLDEILLGTAQDQPHDDQGLPTLPDGWQHAAPLRWLADAPPTRREGMMAMGFGLLALVWAPMGILAVIAGTENAFIALSVVLAVLVLAPRPTSVAEAISTVTDRLRPAAARATAGARGLAQRARNESAPVIARVRTRVATFARDFREAGERAGQVSPSSQSSGLSDPLSRWLDGQSTPSSTR